MAGLVPAHEHDCQELPTLARMGHRHAALRAAAGDDVRSWIKLISNAL